MNDTERQTLVIVPRVPRPNRYYLCCLTGEYRYERDVMYDVKHNGRVFGSFQERGIRKFSKESVEKRLRISFHEMAVLFASLSEATVVHPSDDDVAAVRGQVTEFGIERVQPDDWVTINEAWEPEIPEPPDW